MNALEQPQQQDRLRPRIGGLIRLGGMIKSGLTAEDLTPGLRVDRIVEPQDQTPIGERTSTSHPKLTG